jgi:hypothetical protein
MAYVKKVWKDAPDTSTPINAANLNHMEDGIAEADVNAQNALDRLDDVDDEITQINSDLTAKLDANKVEFTQVEKMLFYYGGNNNLCAIHFILPNSTDILNLQMYDGGIGFYVSHDNGQSWDALWTK